MAVMKTHISWTDSTWNPTTGCTKVSAGCDHCYAEALTMRLGGDFSKVELHPKRIAQAHGFQPIMKDGELCPRLVFVNSMSDLMHENIPDAFRDLVFGAMEGQPRTIFQVLTKRPMTLRRYIEKRYGSSAHRRPGVPENIWLGVSVENNRVAIRIDMLRRLKDAVGNFTAFLSVEPLIGDPDKHRYDRIEWVLIGGESRQLGKVRPMDVAWARRARDEARRVGAAVWFKQFGEWKNNPLYQSAPGKLRHRDKVLWAIERGEKEADVAYNENAGLWKITGEKGGATLDDQVLHELPPHFYRLKAALAPLAL